jgi:rod shape-determining protein MreC
MSLYGRARNTRVLVVSLVMISLLTITVDYRGGQRGPFEVAGRGAYTVVVALQSAVALVLHPIGAFASGIANIGSLKSQNEALRAKVRALEARAGQNDSLVRVNEELRKLLDLKESLQISGVTARVTAESVGNFEWSVNIDAGSTSKIKVNMPVVVGDGLVGHVTEVTPTAAKVELIIDPNSFVAGRLATSGETGLVVGRRNRDLTMDLVNPLAHVLPNEQVVTAGYQGGLYPPEIPIGVVSHIYDQPGSLTKTIDIRPAVDFTSLEYVLVVMKR